MKSTIEFDLPNEEDRHLDALNGWRWKELARIVENHLSAHVQTVLSDEKRSAYEFLLTMLRSERNKAGLTFSSRESLIESNAKHLDDCRTRLADKIKFELPEPSGIRRSWRRKIKPEPRPDPSETSPSETPPSKAEQK